MNALARLALRVLTGISTVFIAACYGIPYDRAVRSGRVVDSQSGARIPGIRVLCTYDAGGEVRAEDVTDAQGEFLLPLDCTEYEAQDVDGTANGSYASSTLAAPPGSDPITIALDPLPQG